MRPTLVKHGEVRPHRWIAAAMWTFQCVALAAFAAGFPRAMGCIGYSWMTGQAAERLLRSAGGLQALSILAAVYLAAGKTDADRINGRTLLCWLALMADALVVTTVNRLTIGEVVFAVCGLLFCAFLVHWKGRHPAPWVFSLWLIPSIGLIWCVVIFTLTLSWVSWDDLSQGWRGEFLIANARQVPTVTALMPTESPEANPGEPVAVRTIRRISLELNKHHDSVNVCVDWSGDDEPSVDYFGPAQMLEYCPQGLGTVYRYESVTPAIMHALAKRHANDFNELAKYGCPQTQFEND